MSLRTLLNPTVKRMRYGHFSASLSHFSKNFTFDQLIFLMSVNEPRDRLKLLRKLLSEPRDIPNGQGS